MKTDQQIQSDVVAELAWTPTVNAAGIGVAVKDGVVTLSGEVDTYLQKHAAEHAARLVGGVRGVAVDLEVRLAPGDRRGDAQVAEAALHALRWHSLVPEDRVQVAVEDGWVTLSGEVDRRFQSASAEEAVRPLLGVRGVSNQIRLRQLVDPADIRAGIESALARHARREAGRIEVAVEGGVATLRGRVGSWAEHEAVIGTAWASKGVTRVVDQLEVVA